MGNEVQQEVDDVSVQADDETAVGCCYVKIKQACFVLISSLFENYRPVNHTYIIVSKSTNLNPQGYLSKAFMSIKIQWSP